MASVFDEYYKKKAAQAKAERADPKRNLQGEQYNASILTRGEFAEAFEHNPSAIQLELRAKYSLASDADGNALYDAIKSELRTRGVHI